MSRLLAAAAVVAAFMQVPPPGQAPLPPGDGLIAGRVIDGASGRPLTGVVVILTPRPGPGAPPAPGAASAEVGGVAAPPVLVLVDGNGRFIFAGLRAGAYDVLASKRGFVSGTFGKLRPDGGGSVLALGDHERRTDLAIRVWKYAAIAGTVVDEANEPVVGVSVSVLRRDWIGGELRLNPSGSAATTDDRGAFRIGSLLPGDYVVTVVSSTNTVPQSALDMSDGPNPSQAIRSALSQVTPSGAPVAGTRDVQRVGDLVIAGSSRGPVVPQPAADGRMTVYPTAWYPEAPGAPAMASVVSLAGGESKSIPAIRLRPVTAVRVSGTVTGPTGASSPTTLVLIPQHVDGFASEAGFQVARTMTDASGEFTFLGVTPGTYRLRAYTSTSPPPPPGLAAPGYVPTATAASWLNETVTVGANDVTLSLVLRAGLSVSGRVVFDGQRAQPQPDQIARNLVTVAYADGRSVSSPTGRDIGTPPGGFTIADVPGGRFVLRTVSTPGGWYLKSITRGGADAIDVPFDITDDVSDVVFTYTDRPAVVRGAVRTSAGADDAEALVIVFSANPSRWTEAGRTPIRMRTTRAGATGTYTFTGLPPGDYLIAAVADVSASTWQTPKYLETLGRQATRIRLDEGATIAQDLRRVEVVK